MGFVAGELLGELFLELGGVAIVAHFFEGSDGFVDGFGADFWVYEHLAWDDVGGEGFGEVAFGHFDVAAEDVELGVDSALALEI